MGLIPDKFHEIGMSIVLMATVLFVAGWIISMTRRKDIDFNAMRLLMSRRADGTWTESRRAVGELTAIIVSTWGFVYLVLADRLTEWYLAAWLGVLLGWAAINKGMEVKSDVGTIEGAGK